MNKEQFAKIIKEKREALNLSQEAFGSKIGVSWITIWRWENQREAPNEIIMKLWIDNIKDLK